MRMAADGARPLPISADMVAAFPAGVNKNQLRAVQTAFGVFD